MNGNIQTVQCRECQAETLIRSDIEITDYQCPKCWHEHRQDENNI